MERQSQFDAQKDTVELKQRDSIFYNFTKSICPECRKPIDAQILVRDNKVYMKKRCSDHGWFEALIFSDFEMYRKFENYNKPGDIPLQFQTTVDKGCPSDCGLCPEHQQHTCLAVFEITEMCNMECPTCFASSKPMKGLHHKTMDEIEVMINTVESSEGTVAVVMLSGGEPTVHPQFLDILQRLKAANVEKIMINSNGKKFALSEEFTRKVAEIGDGIFVYLQFDGFEEETYRQIRGEPNLLATKELAIDNLSKHGIGVNLVMTIVKGINDHEIGDVVNYMHSSVKIHGITFQPLFAEGRYTDYDPMDHTTMADVIHAIEDQTEDLYNSDDFFPIPCPYPHCSAATFSYSDPQTGDFTTISRILEVDEYLDFFRNTMIPDIDNEVLDALESIFSFSSVSGSHEMTEGFCNACGIEFNFDGLHEELQPYLENIKMITVKPFMNSWDFDVRRIMKCCVHQVTEDEKIIPFCAYNAIYRKEYQSETMQNISLEVWND